MTMVATETGRVSRSHREAAAAVAGLCSWRTRSVVACTQMLWLTFAPIDTDVARDFGVSKNAVGVAGTGRFRCCTSCWRCRLVSLLIGGFGARS